MTIRTFKQQGEVYGLGTAAIVAKIDGVVVFDGIVSAINQPFPITYTTDSPADLFTWEDDVNFSGTKTMEITVTGGTILLTETLANYYKISPPQLESGEWPPTASSGPTEFGFVFAKIVDDNVMTDPLTNVTIDGKPLIAAHSDGPLGQWRWKIPAGSTFTATINVLPGIDVDA